MGMFKDLRDLHKASTQFERPTIREALKQSNQAVQAYTPGTERNLNPISQSKMERNSIGERFPLTSNW